MAILSDVISRMKQFISNSSYAGSGGSSSVPEQQQQQKRQKRKIDNPTSCVIVDDNPPLTKYRRVTSDFPKIINHPIEIENGYDDRFLKTKKNVWKSGLLSNAGSMPKLSAIGNTNDQVEYNGLPNYSSLRNSSSITGAGNIGGSLRRLIPATTGTTRSHDIGSLGYNRSENLTNFPAEPFKNLNSYTELIDLSDAEDYENDYYHQHHQQYALRDPCPRNNSKKIPPLLQIKSMKPRFSRIPLPQQQFTNNNNNININTNNLYRSSHLKSNNGLVSDRVQSFLNGANRGKSSVLSTGNTFPLYSQILQSNNSIEPGASSALGLSSTPILPYQQQRPEINYYERDTSKIQPMTLSLRKMSAINIKSKQQEELEQQQQQQHQQQQLQQQRLQQSTRSHLLRHKSIIPENEKYKGREEYERLLAIVSGSNEAYPENKVKPLKSKVDTIEISDDDSDVINQKKDQYSFLTGYSGLFDPIPPIRKEREVVEPVNSLQKKHDVNPKLHEEWLTQLNNSYSNLKLRHAKELQDEAKKAAKQAAETERQKLRFEEHCYVPPTHSVIVLEDSSDNESEVDDTPEFTKEQQVIIHNSIRAFADQVLIKKFNMDICGRDIQTLDWNCLNWLNDAVINFYMNLLMERGEQKANIGYPKVYAMNTFFSPRILKDGHVGVKRWTKKVDIFSYDMIPVPVHVRGIHWCMAIINFKNKTIKYYDSMGNPNPAILNALENYLKDESLDKKQRPFDMSEWRKESVADTPKQQNGSDCGVFSCMFAEFLTRNRPICFTQQHMTYFRQKMVLEIVTGKMML